MNVNFFEAAVLSILAYILCLAGFTVASWFHFSDREVAAGGDKEHWKHKRDGFLALFLGFMIFNWILLGYMRLQFYQWVLTLALQPWLAATTAFIAMIAVNLVVTMVAYEKVATTRGKEIYKILMAESLLKDRPEEIILVKKLGERRVVEHMKRR